MGSVPIFDAAEGNQPRAISGVGKLELMDVSADLALRNAWNSVVATADELKTVAPAEGAPVDLDALQPKVLAQANAAQALRGLIEELRRKAETGE